MSVAAAAHGFQGRSLHFKGKTQGWDPNHFEAESGHDNPKGARTKGVLDGTVYPCINIPDISSGSASVPVCLVDGGQLFDCTMVAGSAAIQVAAATAEQLAAVSAQSGVATDRTAIQPMAGWWICVNESATVVGECEKKVAALREEYYEVWNKRFGPSEAVQKQLHEQQENILREIPI